MNSSLNKICLSVLSLSSLSALAQDFRIDLRDGNTRGSVRIDGNGNVAVRVDERHPGVAVPVPHRPGPHRPGPHRPDPTPNYSDMDPREAGLILRSCTASSYYESRANCFRTNLQQNPSEGFRRIGRAASAGTTYSDQASGAEAALKVVQRGTRSTVTPISAACNAMSYWESKAKCYTAGLHGGSEAGRAVRAGSLAGTTFSDQANGFAAGAESLQNKGGPITSLKLSCDAMSYWESKAKCFIRGAHEVSDHQIRIVRTGAEGGTTFSDQANGASAGFAARLANRSMGAIVSATCEAMSYWESKAKCFRAAGAELSEYDRTLARLLRSCQQSRSYSDEANCAANVLRGL